MIHEIDGLAGDGAGIHPARAPRQNRLLRLVDVPVDEKVAALDREGRHGAGIAAVEGDVVMGEPGVEIDSRERAARIGRNGLAVGRHADADAP